ncbi:hypothetical protein, partial [Escherichia coli]|uniref:hypothetical protein n=2 Tax=Enterobacteriaceae TaxID=543 RepID=UPI001BDB95DB
SARYRCNFITMHCTAFTRFLKPLALNDACDTVIFRRAGHYARLVTQQTSILCATGSEQNPTSIK